ncbi:NADH dehydrogenase [Mucor ambiguus]|uniref:NADH dehydrogenase n=1 Tax=Mucor ambiguus TaxID=91626 RepID=A0A0C9LPM1_9FUNG|nr:NADH dehydrogenase [Mucor ambiguus]
MSWNTKTWSWVKKYFSVNPLSTDGMPVVGKFRTPAPASRPEQYTYPKSSASKIHDNYYFTRDTRRNFPRLAVYTQQDVALLLEGAPVKPSLSAEAATEQVVAETAETKPLVDILSSQKLYTKEKLAPAPRFGRQVTWKTSEDFIPPNDGSYFPMQVVTA